MRLIVCIMFCLASFRTATGQVKDTLVDINHRGRAAQIFVLDSQRYVYPRPTTVTFITRLPKTFIHVINTSFQHKSIKPWLWIAGSTAGLWIADQKISNNTQQLSSFIHLDNSRKYIDVIKFRVGKTDVDVYQAPDNLNTAIYSIGEGMPTILIGAGLLVHGLAKKDYRSLSTSSQLMQGVIAMGIATQFLKRVTGRESPFVATQDRGAWRPFPNLKTYQSNVPHYDAFPSGHMATMMAATTILSENFPEKRWIKPVGYSTMAIVGLAMINNGVHWASDYPLAIGMGYVFGKVTVKMNRWIANEKRR